MGHWAWIHANVNNYTWHNTKITIAKDGYRGIHTSGHAMPWEWPQGDIDVVIAVSSVDVESTLTIPSKRKFWWIRGWETWNMPEARIIEKTRKIKCIANSGWIAERLKCPLCYAGLDLDKWERISALKNIDEIGYLNHYRHKTKNSQYARDIIEKVGAEPMVLESNGNLNYDKLCIIYSCCRVWLSTSTLEGFHQVPAEAALCGCLIAGINHPMSGTGDYLTEDTGILFNDAEDAVKKIQDADYGKIEKMRDVLINKIGDRRSNMQKFVELIK